MLKRTAYTRIISNMNKALPLLAVILALAALLIATIRDGRTPDSRFRKNVALEERLAVLEQKCQALEAAHQRLLDRYGQSAVKTSTVRILPSENLETRLEDLAEKQTELEEFAKSLDRLGIIESMEYEVLQAYDTLLNTNLPVWERAKQADTLKRYRLFGEEAVSSMMDLWNQTEDNNEKSAILYALSGVVATPEFRDQILASLDDEVQNNYPSPKFRHMAVEALEPMLPDPAVEEWLQYMAINDPEPKLRARAGKPLSIAVPEPQK